MMVLEFNGWSIFAHTLFIEQFDNLLAEAIEVPGSDDETVDRSKAAKLLAAVVHIIENIIPADPSSPNFHLGKTLGEGATLWKRVKFHQQYRLFFRYDSRSKIIVLGWMNDSSTLRAYESKNDAYRVFGKMLKSGRPPTKWEDLLAEAKKSPSLADRLASKKKSKG